MTKRKIAYWVIPPEQDAEFVACMEDVLETYAAAYDPKHPVLCMDEQPVQLLKETRAPIAATTMHGTRVDYTTWRVIAYDNTFAKIGELGRASVVGLL